MELAMELTMERAIAVEGAGEVGDVFLCSSIGQRPGGVRAD
jgi:hypothetical protein